MEAQDLFDWQTQLASSDGDPERLRLFSHMDFVSDWIAKIQEPLQLLSGKVAHETAEVNTEDCPLSSDLRRLAGTSDEFSVLEAHMDRLLGEVKLLEKFSLEKSAQPPLETPLARKDQASSVTQAGLVEEQIAETQAQMKTERNHCENDRKDSWTVVTDQQMPQKSVQAQEPAMHQVQLIRAGACREKEDNEHQIDVANQQVTQKSLQAGVPTIDLAMLARAQASIMEPTATVASETQASIVEMAGAVEVQPSRMVQAMPPQTQASTMKQRVPVETQESCMKEVEPSSARACTVDLTLPVEQRVAPTPVRRKISSVPMPAAQLPVEALAATPQVMCEPEPKAGQKGRKLMLNQQCAEKSPVMGSPRIAPSTPGRRPLAHSKTAGLDPVLRGASSRVRDVSPDLWHTQPAQYKASAKHVSSTMVCSSSNAGHQSPPIPVRLRLQSCSSSTAGHLSPSAPFRLPLQTFVSPRRDYRFIEPAPAKVSLSQSSSPRKMPREQHASDVPSFQVPIAPPVTIVNYRLSNWQQTGEALTPPTAVEATQLASLGGGTKPCTKINSSPANGLSCRTQADLQRMTPMFRTRLHEPSHVASGIASSQAFRPSARSYVPRVRGEKER
eukprot:TRINITY_DN27100_c0_g1_i1.p1 TRINITY_DN27100_c0_g1~~TRINITY_DN27100_c0_g1_i1.p1  ORF type:complete len:642 (-),score=100.47 TRINITY_DN27100_c0_g1_i1:53-1897(-)